MSMKRRIRRLEGRVDTTKLDHDAEARRRAKVLTELAEFEARRRSMSTAETEAWRGSPEGQEWIRELEERIGKRPSTWPGAYR